MTISLFSSLKSLSYCAESGLFNVGKTEFFERVSHRAYSDAFVIGYKRRSERHVNRVSRIDKHFRFFRLVDDFFCVLRTHDETVTAKNALVTDYVRLISRKANGFDGAMSDTFVAVFAVRFL